MPTFVTSLDGYVKLKTGYVQVKRYRDELYRKGTKRSNGITSEPQTGHIFFAGGFLYFLILHPSILKREVERRRWENDRQVTNVHER